MKIAAWIMTGINLLFALRVLLSAFDGSSKYSPGMTWLTAIVFLGLGAYGAYALLTGFPAKKALWIGVAPWLTLIVVMFIQLVTGDWQ